LGRFDEDDLYHTLDWLEEQQPRVEAQLARGRIDHGAVFLYDVTSSYFEGQHNELAAPGYNRDGKRHKKQLVAGLLTDAEGEPLSVQLYPGNTADPATFADVVQRLRERFGAADMQVAIVGDRGMIKTTGRHLLDAEGFHCRGPSACPTCRLPLPGEGLVGDVPPRSLHPRADGRLPRLLAVR
jgi:hypothetical protein